MSARARGIAVALVALAVSAACDSGTRSEVGRETAAAVDKAGDAASDARITMTVQAKYFASNEVKGREIDVDTSNGVVTLKGTVNSHSEHNQAVALARSTDGVRDVRDQLQMTPGNQDVRGTVGREVSKVGREANEVGEKVGREANRMAEKASQRSQQRRPAHRGRLDHRQDPVEVFCQRGHQIEKDRRRHQERGGDAERRGRHAGRSRTGHEPRAGNRRRDQGGRQSEDRSVVEVACRTSGVGFRPAGVTRGLKPRRDSRRPGAVL